jgi:hypothetical protein
LKKSFDDRRKTMSWSVSAKGSVADVKAELDREPRSLGAGK